MKALPFSSVDRRDGFVIANSSSRGDAVNKDVARLWAKPCRGIDPEREQHWQSVLVEPLA